MSIFARRLTIDQLRHEGIGIVPSNFVIARKPLVYGFEALPVGSVVPDTMPKHRLAQFHRMRRIDVAPGAVVDRRVTPLFKRNAGDTPELAIGGTAGVKAAAVVKTSQPKSKSKSKSKQAKADSPTANTSADFVPNVDVPVEQLS